MQGWLFSWAVSSSTMPTSLRPSRSPPTTTPRKVQRARLRSGVAPDDTAPWSGGRSSPAKALLGPLGNAACQPIDTKPASSSAPRSTKYLSAALATPRVAPCASGGGAEPCADTERRRHREPVGRGVALKDRVRSLSTSHSPWPGLVQRDVNRCGLDVCLAALVQPRPLLPWRRIYAHGHAVSVAGQQAVRVNAVRAADPERGQ